MTGPGATVSLAEMLDERRHLLDISEWMFGTDVADRIVHETYRRWYALDDEGRAGVAVPRCGRGRPVHDALLAGRPRTVVTVRSSTAGRDSSCTGRAGPWRW
jgi:hypothetical protein